MMFSKLKQVILKKKLDSLLLKQAQERVVSSKEVIFVGILTSDEISSKIDIQKEIETLLNIRHSKIYSFRRFKKSDEFSYKHFTEKDINIKGVFTQSSFQGFIDQPFDLLIGYFKEDNLYLEHAILQSKATFKAGFSTVNPQLYDLEIAEETENVEKFISELKKYLQILKKMKN